MRRRRRRDGKVDVTDFHSPLKSDPGVSPKIIPKYQQERVSTDSRVKKFWQTGSRFLHL